MRTENTIKAFNCSIVVHPVSSRQVLLLNPTPLCVAGLLGAPSLPDASTGGDGDTAGLGVRYCRMAQRNRAVHRIGHTLDRL